MNYPKVAQRITDLLARYDMTARELSYKTGVSEASISQYVNGNHKPSPQNAAKIAAIYGVNQLWVMGYDVSKDQKAEVVTELESSEESLISDEALRYGPILYGAGFILRRSEDYNDVYSLSPSDNKLFNGFSVNLSLDELREYNSLLESVVKEATCKLFYGKMQATIKELRGDS